MSALLPIVCQLPIFYHMLMVKQKWIILTTLTEQNYFIKEEFLNI